MRTQDHVQDVGRRRGRIKGWLRQLHSCTLLQWVKMIVHGGYIKRFRKRKSVEVPDFVTRIQAFYATWKT